MPPPPPRPAAEPDDDAPTEAAPPGPAQTGQARPADTEPASPERPSPWRAGAAGAAIPGQRAGARRATASGDAPASGAPASDAPARSTSTREVPARDTPVRDTPEPARPTGTDTEVSGETPEPAAERAPARKAPAKRAPAKRTTKKTAATAAPAPARADTAPAVARPATLWDRLLADPAHAPELLALGAVERLGPEAARYTGWIHATYPGATDDRVAQAAARRFTVAARHGALAGAVLAGSAVPGAVRAAVLGWQQARLVLHVAAAYGQDPRAPERAAELLVLLRVHGDLSGARDALATARETGVPLRRPAGPLLSAGLLGAGRRLAARLVPGAGVLVDVLVNDAVMEGLARRAIGMYRSGRLRAPATVAAVGARQGGTSAVTTD